MVGDPSVSAGDINDVISKDVALSARILKLVNSAFYGFPRRIASVTHAIVILGFNALRNVTLSASVFDLLDSRDLPFGHREFWIHSIGVAVAANVIARERKLPDVEDAFMCGLLHDVGKIVLHQYARGEFGRVLK
jgi:HD-like signal output (HDOD) protein